MMTPVRIQGATRVMRKPVDWDDSKGVCLDLHIRDEVDDAGRSMSSAWSPSAEDIAKIVAGAPIILNILGTVHPPVAITVGDSSPSV